MASPTDRVTIKQALSRGMWMVNFPVMAIMFGPWLITWLASDYAPKHSITFPDWILACLIALSVVSIPLAWIWWSFKTPQWKHWAYSRVEKINDLKHAAIAAGLIWPDGSIFEKTEICSKTTRQEILKLEGRL